MQLHERYSSDSSKKALYLCSKSLLRVGRESNEINGFQRRFWHGQYDTFSLKGPSSACQACYARTWRGRCLFKCELEGMGDINSNFLYSLELLAHECATTKGFVVPALKPRWEF